MLTKSELLENYQDIVASFSDQRYFGNVHTLETADEGLCTFYYIELKTLLSNYKSTQFSVLWMLLELSECPDQYARMANADVQEALRVSFQYQIDNWEPRVLESADRSRMSTKLLECQSSVNENTNVNGWGTDRAVGYYLNNKYKGSSLPSAVTCKFLTAETGFVLTDEWNEYLAVIEIKNTYSIVFWATGA